MATTCNREAFKFSDECPKLDVDTTFPDFEACESFDSGKLKGVARFDLQKTPAVPVTVPSLGQFPIPDIDEDDCPISTLAAGGSTFSIGYDESIRSPQGSIAVRTDQESCKLLGIDIKIRLPQPAAAATADAVATIGGGVALVIDGASFEL